MPTEATVVSKTEKTGNSIKIKYSVPSVAASGTTEYAMPISPYSDYLSLDEFYIVCASTTVTLNLSDTQGVSYPSTEIGLRVEDINLTYDENGLGVRFYPSAAYLYLTIVNDDTVATGVNTVTMTLRR